MSCWSPDAGDEVPEVVDSAAAPDEGRHAARSTAGRVTISQEVYQVNGKEVVLMGGNYVVKAQPFYPPLEVVRKDAQLMAQGARSMAYTPPPAANGDPRPVLPCVRLGAMMEAAMPESGGTVDPKFKEQLEGVVKTFQEEGVYVFFDMHQDAFCTTNGGEGYPYWVPAEFQKTAGCFLEQCCCCCCFSNMVCASCHPKCQTSYITSPEHALRPFFCLCNCLASKFNLDIMTYDQDSEPWKPYSVDGDAGNPAWMNVGNASMRRNNADGSWSRLVTSAQVENSVRRLYNSANDAEDRKIFFDPFVTFAKYLNSVWEKYDNVVAVELMNEPPMAGLPDVCYVLCFLWGKVLSFQADVLRELSKDSSIKVPFCIANWSSTVEGESTFVKLLSCLPCTSPSDAMETFQSYTAQNRLILSFHFYSPPSSVSFEENIQLAKKNAQKLGNVPIFLSEYYENSAQEFADQLAVAVNCGANAVTYWQYVDSSYTKQQGWFIYPPDVVAKGALVDSSTFAINTAAWDLYAPTVADGTFWGAYITGAGGGQMNVLELVPATEVSSCECREWMPYMTPLHKAHKFHQAAKDTKDL